MPVSAFLNRSIRPHIGYRPIFQPKIAAVACIAANGYGYDWQAGFVPESVNLFAA